MTNRTAAAPKPARQLLSAARPWALALGGGAALGLGLAQCAGATGALRPLAAIAAAPAAAEAGIWFEGNRPSDAATNLLVLLREADEEGLDPAAYPIREIETALAAADDAPGRARATALLETALAAYARDLAVPRSLSEVAWIDPELIPTPPAVADLLADGAPAERLRALHAGNPLYTAARTALGHYRAAYGRLPQVQVPEGTALAPGSRGQRVALLRRRLGLPAGSAYDAGLAAAVRTFREVHGLAPSPIADRATIAALNRGAAHYEGLLLADMDRLRGLPAAGRYVLVDTAAARLRMIEDGREAGAMKVVVGKPGMETPMLAGLIRYALVNPYWNVPPDLVRATIAPAVLREGPAALERRRYVLSADWSTTERIAPAAVDWPGVAAGRASVWVRQLPGARNMMGRVKFMLPNDMGIYLHDTPDKALFAHADRRMSSGCVRLEDAPRLARWLFGRPILEGDPAPDRRVDLAEPVPVFTIALNAGIEGGEARLGREQARPPLTASRR